MRADIAQRYVLSIAEQVLPAGSPALSEIKIGIAAYLGQRAKTISPFADDLIVCSDKPYLRIL